HGPDHLRGARQGSPLPADLLRCLQGTLPWFRDVRGDGAGPDRHGPGEERRHGQRRQADLSELDTDELPAVGGRSTEAGPGQWRRRTVIRPSRVAAHSVSPTTSNPPTCKPTTPRGAFSTRPSSRRSPSTPKKSTTTHSQRHSRNSPP